MSRTVVRLDTETAADGAAREVLRVALVGHVDHGKSTLIGRLLHDTGAVSKEQVSALRRISRRRGKPIEWGYLLDALQAERDQAVTIDTAHIRLRTAEREYVIVDTPGHKEFLRNMVTGAADVDAALLVIDAVEGVQEQTRRHAYLLHLLGVRQVAVVVNKMDLVDYGQAHYGRVERDITGFCADIGMTPAVILPAAASTGANLASASPDMKWHDGPTLLQALRGLATRPSATNLPLRLPVQDVYKFDRRRILVGRIETGVLRVGDRIMFSPSNKTTMVKSIEAWNADAPPVEAGAGSAVGITLTDPLFIERGEVISHLADMPLETNVFRARLFWLGDEPLHAGQRLTLKLATSRQEVTVQSIDRVIDPDTLDVASSERVARHGVAEVVLRARAILALDEFARLPALGRFVLQSGAQVVGGGTISMRGYPDQRGVITVRGSNLTPIEHHVTAAARAARSGHEGGVIWMTGLPGAGKSTLALELERELFRRGLQVYVLDGDNVRSGLNANLSFSPEDRAENIRRVGEVAAMFADAGFIVISAFISPYRADRRRARAATKGAFHEVYIKADLATCERRDPKGLFKRARAGEIKDLTGVNAPYEVPEEADLVVDTTTDAVKTSVGKLVEYVVRNFAQSEVANVRSEPV